MTYPQPMVRLIFSVCIIGLSLNAFAQEEAVTASGKVVLLFPDSTWKLKPQLLQTADSLASDSTSVDSLALAKPEKHIKEFSDTTIGFKGFLKTTEFKLPSLPDYSDGVYEYRVKINKEGYVKEVITMKRGPNGSTDQVIRNAINRYKFRPDGSIVPPLTEGTFRVTVPAIKK